MVVTKVLGKETMRQSPQREKNLWKKGKLTSDRTEDAKTVVTYNVSSTIVAASTFLLLMEIFLMRDIA